MRRTPGLAHIRAVRETNMRLHAVARELEESERHLRRVIRQSTGSGPKHHDRVVRLNRALTAADHDPDPSWARLAARHGFDTGDTRLTVALQLDSRHHI